jgi:hypothetical protein
MHHNVPHRPRVGARMGTCEQDERKVKRSGIIAWAVKVFEIQGKRWSARAGSASTASISLAELIRWEGKAQGLKRSFKGLCHAFDKKRKERPRVLLPVTSGTGPGLVMEQ